MTETGLAALSRALGSGRSSSSELVKRCLDRIAALNPDGNIFITVMSAGAEEAAAESDARRREGRTWGRLDGIPIAIKDNIDVAGVPTSAGAVAWRDRVATTDATVVRRLRAAGAVVVGKLNLHEGGLGTTTDNPYFGRCTNPIAPGYSPGGSSGGSAAAVAAGIVPLALGSDTLGSIRIPAAYCGVWGLKPTDGLVGRAGLRYLSWTLDMIGPLATSAEDLLLGLQIIAGVDANDPGTVRAPPNWRTEIADLDISGLVLGRPAQLEEVNCEPEVLDAFARLETHLRSRGAEIRTVSLEDWHPTDARREGLLVCEAEGASLFGEEVANFPEGFSTEFRELIAYGKRASADRLARAYWRLDRIRLAVAQVLNTVDALILPTAPQRAFPHGSPAPNNQADLTSLANIAKLPAVAFPIGCGDGERPVSAQLIGRPFSEPQILSVALAISGFGTGSRQRRQVGLLWS